MKKMGYKILFLLMVIFVLPIFAVAEEISSDISLSNTSVKDFGTDKLFVRNISYTRYTRYLAYGEPALTIGATIGNTYSRKIDAVVELTFYDKNEKVLDIFKKSYPEVGKEQYFCFEIFENNVNYSFDNIKYYSLKLVTNDDLDMIASSEKDEYVFENYNIKINVNRNNQYNIEESFDLKFKKNIDTFVFSIPYRLKYTLEDGSKINKRMIMSNINVNEELKLKTEDGNRNLYIGSSDRSDNRKSYTIKYDYNAFDDTIEKQDDFVFYLVNNRENKIDGLSFEINFPDELKGNKVYFMDQHGTKLDSVEYKLDGNKVTGKFDYMINSNVLYAIKVVLKDGYFKKTDNNVSKATILTLIVSVFAFAFTMIIWLLQKKKNNNYKCDSIYFNDKINSLEMGYLLNGKVKDNDIATLLISLANKGFIEIEKEKKKYRILKVKEYDQDDRTEKVFMKELFQNEDVITRKELVHNVDYMRNNIEFKLQGHKKKNRLYIRPVINYKLIFWFMIFIIYALCNVNIYLEYQISSILYNTVIGMIGYVVMLYGILYDNIKIEKVIYIFVGLMFIVAPIVLSPYQAFFEDELKLTTYIIGIVSMLVIITISRLMNNRSLYGKRMLNKIYAYKDYLINFEDIDKAIKDNKYCFYEVLPYAFVLGISDRWYHKFADSNIVKPKWYDSDEFKLEDFYKNIKDIYADIFISIKNSEK